MPNYGVGTINAKTPASTLVLNSSNVAVAADNDRVGLSITNISASTVYLAFGDNYAVVKKGVVLTPNGGIFNMDEYLFSNERVSAIADNTNSVICIQEFKR